MNRTKDIVDVALENIKLQEQLYQAEMKLTQKDEEISNQSLKINNNRKLNTLTSIGIVTISATLLLQALRPQEKENTGFIVQPLKEQLPNSYLDTLSSYKKDLKTSINFADQLKNKHCNSLDINFGDVKISLDTATSKYIHEERAQIITPKEGLNLQQITDFVFKDYEVCKNILKEVSKKICNIQEEDSYSEKVYKIQQFVGKSITYENDAVYRSLHATYISDYQTSALVTLLTKQGDCNNKTGLFVELCRVNGIVSAIGSCPGHVFPLIGYKKSDLNYVPIIFTANDLAFVPIESTSPERPSGKLNDNVRATSMIQIFWPDH